MEVVGEIKIMVKIMRKAKKSRTSTRVPNFGAVSRITTAPVAIGNSMQGAKAQVINLPGGNVRVVGRDYAFTAIGTGTAVDWRPVGGFPLTPACFVSSTLRAYTQIYNKFKFNKLICHYITSSPTSSAGDVMFQVNKNRVDPCANYDASSFLNYALSDPHTVIGPQWTNHTCVITPSTPYRTIDIGLSPDLDYQSQGEVFLYSKTPEDTLDSPGYVVIDYDITFGELSVHPRAGVLPNPNLLYFPYQLILNTGTSYTTSQKLVLTDGTLGLGNTTITKITSTPNYRSGDIYKFNIDLTASTFSAATGSMTSATFMSELINGGTAALAITSGYTLYMCVYSSTAIQLYATITNAMTNTNPLNAGATYTTNSGTTYLIGSCSWVANIKADNMQQL